MKNIDDARPSFRILKHQLIPMRDGVNLSAHVILPKKEGKYPAILEYTPYRKGDFDEPWWFHRGFVDEGYAYVIVDVRGTGDSGGVTDDVYCDDERRDGYEVVEWIAAQPWCGGNVGMMGISYSAVVCSHVAVQRPPHLKAIIVRCGHDDNYTEWTNPGGCPRPFMYEAYGTYMAGFNFLPPNRSIVGPRWAEMWRERLDGNVPWGIGFISHQLDDAWSHNRSLRPGYDRVQCPVFVIDGWADWYFTPLLRAFTNLQVPKRALIGPWSHTWLEEAIPGPRVDGTRECLKWFDHWLKGIDTGVMREPPVTIFVREYLKPATMFLEDKGRFRSENEWPIARTQEQELPLVEGSYEYRPDLGLAAGMHGGGPFTPWGMPLDQREDEVYSLVTTTAPLTDDCEITGHPRAVLRISSTADITMFTVKLCDVAPDGTSNLITKGYLNATHRDSHSAPEPLTPGEVYEITIELMACAYLVRKDHRIRVAVASSDMQHCWPTPKRCKNTIHAGSRLVLPIVPPQVPPLTEPELRPSPRPAPEGIESRAPEYFAARDFVNETTTVGYQTRVGTGLNRAGFTVSSKDPAKAVVKATYDCHDISAGMAIDIQIQCVTSSDEKAFHHLVEAEITVNNRPYFQKSWNVSVPRLFC